MRVYHSGFDIIKEPDISTGRKNADFGPGFYLSPNNDFAMRWSKRREGSESYINIYELNTDGLNIKRLERNEEWFDYISSNRNGRGDKMPDYDLIIGPIANDTLYDVYGIPTSGVLSKEESLGLLKLGNEYQQIVVKTERAVENLQWLDATVVDLETANSYREILKAEADDYRRQFSEYLED